MIERVEVMRGGGSALFGSSAIAGTINIITKEPLRNSGQLAHTLTSIGGSSSFDNNTSLNASLVTDNHRAGLYVFGQNRHRDAYDHDGDGYSEMPNTDNGDTQLETPEAGAEFAVFLKATGSYDSAKASERDYLTCDENGYAATKDLPYGIYTVHQTKGWDGRELLADFDVYIAKDGQTYRYLTNNRNFESYIKIVKVDAETG